MTPEASQTNFSEPTGATISDGDTAALMSQIESGGEVTQPAADPGTQSATTTAQGQAQTTAGPATTQTKPPVPEVEFTWNGKQIKVPLDRATQWAQQGYDYAQKMAAFKQEQAQFQKSQQETQAIRERYAELEDYVSKNPEWWDHVNQNWKQTRAADPNNPLAQEIQALKAQLGEVNQFKQEIITERQQQQLQQADQQLDKEIQSVRDQFKDLDWATANEEGKNLEYQVLEFATQKGIRSFQDAFKIFNHDRLLKLAEERGKEAVVKERQKATKQGLLGHTQAPTKGTANVEIRNKSYDDLLRLAAEEYGIA